MSSHFLLVPLKSCLHQFRFCNFLIFSSHHHLSCHSLVEKKALVFMMLMVTYDRASSCEILKNFDRTSKELRKNFERLSLGNVPSIFCWPAFLLRVFLTFSYLSRIRLNLLRSPLSGWKLVIKLLSKHFAIILAVKRINTIYNFLSSRKDAVPITAQMLSSKVGLHFHNYLCSRCCSHILNSDQHLATTCR